MSAELLSALSAATTRGQLDSGWLRDPRVARRWCERAERRVELAVPGAPLGWGRAADGAGQIRWPTPAGLDLVSWWARSDQSRGELLQLLRWFAQVAHWLLRGEPHGDLQLDDLRAVDGQLRLGGWERALLRAPLGGVFGAPPPSRDRQAVGRCWDELVEACGPSLEALLDEDLRWIFARLHEPVGGQPHASWASFAAALERWQPGWEGSPRARQPAALELTSLHELEGELRAQPHAPERAALEVRYEQRLRQLQWRYPRAGWLHDRLAAHYSRLQCHALGGGLAREAARYAALAAHSDRGELAGWLSGWGELELVAEGGLITLERAGSQVPPVELAIHAGVVRLPAGSYLLHQEETTFPVVVLAGERARCVVARPDAMPEEPARPESGEAGWCWVAPGAFQYGGDSEGDYPLPASRPSVDGFWMARFPVTMAQYHRFIEALSARDPELARRRAPRVRGPGGLQPLWRSGRPLHPQRPVVGIDHGDACAFAAWRSQVTGLSIRLPTEREWEKAARGVDGRLFPWGDTFSAERCWMRHSPQDGSRPAPAEVGRAEHDRSPYGVRDLAGGVMEWCLEGLDPLPGAESGGPRLAPVRGGSWHSSPQACRAADRFACPVRYLAPSLGFRLVCVV